MNQTGVIHIFLLELDPYGNIWRYVISHLIPFPTKSFATMKPYLNGLRTR